MDYTVIIPARFASSRLPGKPLLDIAGKPMIRRVWEQACASGAGRVVIATDDARVADCVAGFGAEVCMTAASHESGTDRLQQAAQLLGLDDDAVVVNVQGDEPLLPPPLVDQVASNLVAFAAGMATLCVPIDSVEEFMDPNAVKVVTDQEGYALYFSRAPIPWPRDEARAGPALPAACGARRHVGIYAYRAGFLHRFVRWPVSPLEATEKLEQLRAMTQGVRIHVAEAATAPPAGVDTETDLARVRGLLAAGG